MTIMLPVLFDLFGTFENDAVGTGPFCCVTRNFHTYLGDDFDQKVYLFTYLHPEKPF
jgi:hypothetical protein